MAGFSVRKPFTVLVVVVIVFALGFTSFRTMKPELLPSIELPYVIAMTTYPGATSEKVETEVSRPLEQSFATLEGLKSISSQSRANFSMIMLEFVNGVNLDGVSLDILQKISQVEGNWDDLVGTPIIIKMNPNMLPVMIAAVEQEGSNTAELSRLMDETLQTKLEGIDGVASVNTNGMRREQVNVAIRKEKVDAVNARIAIAVENEIGEKERDLRKTRADLEAKIEDLKKKNEELNDGVKEFADGIGKGTTTLGESWVEYGIPLAVQLAEMKKMLEDLEKKLAVTQKRQDADIQAIVDQTIEAMIEEKINTAIEDAKPMISAAIVDKIAEIEAGLASYVPPLPPLTPEQKAEIEAEITEQYIAQITAMVTAGFTDEVKAMIAAQIWEGAEKQIKDGIKELKKGIDTMETVLDGFVQAQVTIDVVTIETQYQLASGAAALISAQVQLGAGIAQIESGLEQFNEALENALNQADMSSVLTMGMAATLLKAQNFSMPAGTVKQDNTDYLVRVGDEVGSIEELENMALMDTGMDEVGVIRLGDIADVFMSDNLSDIYAKVNGNDGILITFSKQSERSTTEVADAIMAKFSELSAQYPGLKFTPLMNQGDYIYRVVDSIVRDLLWGALFAVLILLLFLRDLRPTFITLCSIPISLVFALTAMYFSGVTINIISLGGLAIAVGRLVDDSVVVIENIFRLRAKGYSPVKAAVNGASQVAGAITASTLTTICVFMPLVFVQGLTRQLFKDFGLTFAFALLASLAVAMTLVPTLASGMFKNMAPKEHRWLDRMIAVYDKSLVWTLRYKPVVLIITVVFLAASAGAVLTKGFEYFPDSSMMNQISITLKMPKESTKEQRRETADEAMARILEIDGVDTVGMMSVGSGGIGGGGLIALMSSSSGSGNMRSVTSYILVEEGADTERIRAEIESALKTLDTEADISAGGGMDASMLGGSGVTINIFGDDVNGLMEASKTISEAITGLEGIAEIDDGLEDTTPELHFTVDKLKAAEYGLTTAQVFQQVSAALTKESRATQITWKSDSYDVVIVNEDVESDELTPDYIKALELYVTKRDGTKEKVKLASISTMSESQTLPSLLRSDQRRYLPVSITVDEDYNVTLVTQDIERAIANIKLSPGISYEVTGESATIMDAFQQLGIMLVLGLLLVYLIMVAQFQSLKSPFIIMFTIPLAFTGGFLALLVTHSILSVISLIGFAMLVGIIVANAIVLVDYINRLRLDGMERVKAIREGAATRMRPILMTALATIFALLVMALGIGGGSNMLQPLAIVCIGGLAYGTLMTLFVVPIIYDLFNRKELRKIAAEDLVIDREA